MKFIFRVAITAAALLIVAYIVPGISVSGWVPAVVAGTFVVIANVIARPILIILTLPLTILSLGLFIFVINATILTTVASFVAGIHIENFGAALLASVLMSIIGIYANKKN